MTLKTRGNRAVFFIVGAAIIGVGIVSKSTIPIGVGVLVLIIAVASLFLPNIRRR